MPVTVRLDDIVDALDTLVDESPSYLDLATGQVVSVSEELLSEAEEPDNEDPELLDWQKDEWEIAKRIASTDRFLELPTQFDVNEWEIMQDFSRSAEPDPVREDLLRAIHGTGAFRNFKDAIRLHGIESSWYAFRTQALRQIAIEWCEENQVAWK